MSTELRCEANPFETLFKATPTSTETTTSNRQTQQPDVLATADLLLEQLKELENLCSTVEQRVQRKRQALKELEHLVLGSNSVEGSPRSPVCPTNTPIASRLQLVSPRLRGLFDLRGPGQANPDAIQTCLDYSAESLMENNVSTREDSGHPEEWVDDEEAPLLSGSPFDDKYALAGNLGEVEKELPVIPTEGPGGGPESKIPRKVHVRRQASTTRKPPGTGMRGTTSHRRHPSVRSVKAKNAVSNPPTKGTMRRGSWKRSIMGNVKTKNGAKSSSAIENEVVKETTRRKEKRKGLWSIYSVCSELGLSGNSRAI